MITLAELRALDYAEAMEDRMATKPKPMPEPEPEPEPKPEEDEAAGISLLERVENLENRMTALETRVNAPPIGLGRR